MPEHAGGPQSTGLSLAATMLLLGAILAYAISTGDRWVAEPPLTSFGLSPTPAEQNVTIPRTCVALPNITDPSYFGVTLQRQDRNKAGGTAQRTNLGWYADGPNKMCVNTTNDSYMRGFCNPGNCAIVKFKLYFCGTCDTGGVQNPSCGRTDCASYSTLSSILQGNFMAVTYETMNGPILLNAAPKSDLASSYATSFDFNVVEYLADYWRRFSDIRETGLTLNNNGFALSDVYTPNEPTREVAEVVLQLSAEYVTTTHAKTTLLNLIASWGALFGVAASVLAIPLTIFNRRRFYRQNPTWAGIGPDFLPMAASPCKVSYTYDTNRFASRRVPDKELGPTERARRNVAALMADPDVDAAAYSHLDWLLNDYRRPRAL
jgi:hypothetical protein